MSLRAGSQEQPSPGVSRPMAKKGGIRQCLFHFFSRSEMNLQELQKQGSEGGRPSLMGSRDPLQECHPGRRKKRPRKQKATHGASVEDMSSVPMKQATAESPSSSRSQKSASKAHALSHSESDLWQNGLHKFGSLAWWKQRRHRLQLSGNPPSNPQPLGRLQRPAVGSDADMRMRSDSCKDGNDTGKLERSKPSSQLPEDSSRSSLVPSTSLDSLLCWGDESSWEGSFSLSNSSLSCLTAHEKKMEALKLLSGQEQNHTSSLPLSTWAHWALDGYFTSGGSKLTVVGEPKNYSSDFGESVSQHLSGLEESKTIKSPQMAQSLKVPDVVQTSQAEKGPKTRYEIRITLTRKEEEKAEDGIIEGEATEASCEKGLLCHPCEEEILSLGFAELEKKEERHHHKPAQPAPGLSACKEFQNCTVLHRVETCKVCGVTQNLATRNLAITALLCKFNTNPEEGKDPREIDPLSSGDDTLAEGTECVASETSANRTRGIPLAAQNKSPERPFETERGPFHPQHSMEKTTSGFQSCLNRAGKATASTLKWKKSPPEPPKEEVKSPVHKTSMTRGRGSAQTSSPSRVSLLLEAWEKGLVGMDTSDTSSSSAEGRRSRSPGNSRRLRSAKDSLFPLAAGCSPSPLNPSADARQSLSPAETRRSVPSAVTKLAVLSTECRRPLFLAGEKRSHSPTDTRHAFSPGVSRRTHSPADSIRSCSPANSKHSPSPSTNRHSFPSDPVQQLLSPLKSPLNARRSCFMADAPHLSSLASIQNSLSSAENLHSSSTVEKHHSSSPVDTEYSSPLSVTNGLPSVADIRRLYACRDSRGVCSPASTNQPFPSEETRCLSSPVTKHLAKPSSFLEKSRSFSPTSTGRHSPSRSSPRDFKAHRAVFAQVYSPVLKPKMAKSQGRTEIQEDHGGMRATSPKENHSCDTAEACLATGLHGDIPCADGSEKESYSSRTADVPLSCGGSYMPSALNANPDASRVLSPKPHVCSTTIAGSQTQWYGSDRSSMVVFRSEQRVIVPQDGTATVYTAGREVIMSSSGVGSIYKAQPETSPLSSSINCVPSKENWQPKKELPEVESPKEFLSSLSDAHSYSQIMQPESCTIQSKSANLSDTQRQRCMFVPIRNEGVPFRNPKRDSSLHGETAFQKHSSLFPTNRSQKEQSTSLPGVPLANGPEKDDCLSRVEKACTSGAQGIWCSSEAARDSNKFKTFAGSQEIAPCDEDITCQSELRDEQQGPRKDCQMFAAESNFPVADTTSSSQESLSQKTGSSNRMVEPEPEEVVDMDLLVDTLRNMEPADPRKPLKLFTRPPRPSALAKHIPLPPIHEDHVAPKSQVSLPTALGELFTLAEEKNTQEGEEPKEEDTAIAENTMEEIKNPYPSKDDNLQDKKQTTKFYPWESTTFKTEEEIGSFLGKLQKSLGHPDSRCIAPKAIANHNNTIRANIFKGVSLLSTFSDTKLVEENRPYSRLDNSLLYSRFIYPEKTQHRDPAKGKDMRSSLTFLNTTSAKINREGQPSPNGPWLEGTYQGRSWESLPSGQPDPSSKVTGVSRSSTLVKEAKSASQPDVQLQEEKAAPKKINVRPGKIILFSELGFGGQKREIWGDITDGTPWLLSHTISVRVIRGGWVMYEKPRFHGRKCVLAEGDVEISNPWTIYHKEGEGTEPAPFRIGSLKRVVHDYRIPEISLFSEENGEGTKQRFTDSSEDTRIHGQPLQAASIIVHSGLWLIYSKPFFDDDPYVLEPGGYPSLQAWGAKSPCICSMHPIKLGSPVVEKPGEPKALIYEKPHFQGCSWEVSRDIYDLKKPENNQDSKMLTAGSLRIMGGCWVGYEKEGFRGHQYLLEEGEYYGWTQWGGYNEELVSLRLIRTDFLDPAIVLFEAPDFEEGPSIELNEALPDVELASYGVTTQSVHVVSGVWVAYEGKNFTGEQYILEKGVYRNCEDWGASHCQISSVQPILQVGEHSLHFISKIQLFSGPDFLGSHISFEEDQTSIPEHLIPCSCRVNGGSWILYDGQWFEGEQHILSEGEYPTLTSMGCHFTTAIRSLRKVPIFFSEPSIFLHGLEFFEGKEIELNGEVRSLQAEGFNNHVLSVRVKGGIWVLCEHSDFRGRQWLLECMEISNWLTYSGLQHIGSLYPIRQKRIFFRIKNEELKSFLSVPDDVEDMKAGCVLVSELSDTSSSIWYYEEGLLKNQVAPFMSLQVIGPAGKGSKVVLWSESRIPRQSWRIDSFRKICSQMFEDKVLDVKGGISYDKDHAILWDSAEERPTQIWDIQVL